jgi:hypothetical protein
MLPVEDWEKAGPIQPNPIERTTIRKTRDGFMIGPSGAVRADPVRAHGLNIKRLRYLANVLPEVRPKRKVVSENRKQNDLFETHFFKYLDESRIGTDVVPSRIDF